MRIITVKDNRIDFVELNLYNNDCFDSNLIHGGIEHTINHISLEYYNILMNVRDYESFMLIIMYF